MKPIRQLLRRPGKTILGVILVALACALLCVSVGQYYAACQMEAQIQKEYTTVAVPTNKYKTSKLLDENGNVIGTTYLSSQPPEVRGFLAGLAESYPTIVESVGQHGFVSGYCASINPVSHRSKVIMANGDGLSSLDGMPYTCAILAISIDEISAVRPYMSADLIWGDMNPEGFGVVADVKGTVLEVCSLPQGYADPTGRTIQIELRTEDAEAFDALGLKVGGKYLAYSSNYRDLDWLLRQELAARAGGQQSVFDGISWDNIRMLSDEEREILNKDNHLYGDEEDYVAKYEGICYLKESELAYIDSCSITICSNPAVAQGLLTQEEVLDLNSDGLEMMSLKEYVQQYRQAGIRPMNSAASDEVWETARATTEINNHAFPVITTGNLQSVAQFASQDAHITAGRCFTQEEYESGSSVCVISETLAVSNGLSVGDSITIQYYETDYNIPGQNTLKPANPDPAYYSQVKGFSGEAVSYEIVGLYRQSNEWSDYDYSFTPNTIFVPQNSVTCQTETSDSGIFGTFILKNGTSGELDAELEKAGYPGLFSYYDQGFSQIAESLNEYFSVAKTILLIGAISWLVFVTAFLILFPLHQKKDAQRMWTLGTPESQITNYITGSGIGILLPGCILGSVASMGLLKYVLKYIGNYANISQEFSLPFLLVILVTGLQVIFITGLVYLTAKALTRFLSKE